MQAKDQAPVSPLPGNRSVLRTLAGSITGVYFTGGIATAMVDTLVPKFKALFSLTYTEAMLTQFCFFIAYLLCSVPAGWLGARIGLVRGTVTGIAIMAIGCLLFAPAARMGAYPAFLLALFILSGGTNLFQVCANPLIASLGKPAGAHSRLTLGLAFNSLGYALGPLIGATFILAVTTISSHPVNMSDPVALHAFQVAESQIVQKPFVILAAILVVIAVTFFWLSSKTAAHQPPPVEAGDSGWAVWKRPRLLFGTIAMFLYVGAEVSIGSILISYLGLPKTLGLDMVAAGKLVSLYWLGAMAGRFAGAILLRFFRPGVVLACHAGMAIVLIVLSLISGGWMSGSALIAVGLCNSVMFPSIFTLSIEGLGKESSRGAALICMAIVGGAVVPMICGAVADSVDLTWAPIVPALCYVGIAAFGLAIWRNRFPIASFEPEPQSATKREWIVRGRNVESEISTVS